MYKWKTFREGGYHRQRAAWHARRPGRFLFSGMHAQQADWEASLVELEVPLVVELEQGWTVRMTVLEVHVVHLWLVGGVAALFADVDLGTALLVRVLVLDAVNLERVRLQGAALCERLVTHHAFVGPHTCMRASVPLKVKGVVEAFPTEGAQVAFHVAVTLHMPVQEPLKTEALAAHLAGQPVLLCLGLGWR